MTSDVKMFIMIMEQKGYKLQQEFQFHSIRKFRFDYAIEEFKIGIEVEGGVFTKGAHGSITGILRDMEKYNLATSEGWSILRTLPSKIMDYDFIKIIEQTIENKKSQVLK